MKDGQYRDEHKGSYNSCFPYFEENRMLHAAYGETIARYVRAIGARNALSEGIGHTEVARTMLSTLTEGPLQPYVVVDAATQIIADFARSLSPPQRGLELLHGFFETFEYPARFEIIEAGFILEHPTGNGRRQPFP